MNFSMMRLLTGAGLCLVMLTGPAVAESLADYKTEIRTLVREIRELQFDVTPIKPQIAQVKASQTEIKPDKGAINKTGQKLVKDVTELNKAMSDLKAQETGKQIRLNLSADILFDFDRADIKPAAAAALQQAAVIIQARRQGYVWVYGHTDSKGSDSYNLALSQRRALSVMNWLVYSSRFPTNIFVTKGFGESYPIAPNTTPQGLDDPAGRARNRRVEIIIDTVQR